MHFEYLKPESMDEALALLEQHADEAKVIAGGTDLMLQIRNRTSQPKYVIDISAIPGLTSISQDNAGGLSIGPLVTMADLESSPLVNQKFTVLAQAAAHLGSVAIRNVATVGGNLCNALPSAETAQALLALGAKVRITGPGHTERLLDLEQFFTGAGRTVLKPQELLTEILVPAPTANTRSIYFKHVPRGSIDLAIVNLAVVAAIDPQTHVCKNIRIAMGAVGTTPVRALEAEKLLIGNAIDDTIIEKAAGAAYAEANPRPGSIRGSVKYKKAMIRVLLTRALKALVAAA